MFEHQNWKKHFFRMQRLGKKNNLNCIIVRIQMNLPCQLYSYCINYFTQ